MPICCDASANLGSFPMDIGKHDVVCGNFDIIFGHFWPFLTDFSQCALPPHHAPCDGLYLATMLIGCG